MSEQHVRGMINFLRTLSCVSNQLMMPSSKLGWRKLENVSLPGYYRVTG